MTPEERIALLETQMAELLQRLNSAPSVVGAGSHLAVEKARFNGVIVADSDNLGTRDPVHPLHVIGQGGAVALLESVGQEVYLSLSTQQEGFNKRAGIMYRPGGRLALFNVTNGDVLNITQEGNVGIGTTNPSHPFHVVAQDAVGLLESTGTQAFLRLSTNEGIDNRVEIANRPGGRLSLYNPAKGDVFNVTREGNVGIGTESPAEKLEVNGNTKIDGNLSITGELLAGSIKESGQKLGERYQPKGDYQRAGDYQPAGNYLTTSGGKVGGGLDLAGALRFTDGNGDVYKNNWIGVATNLGDGQPWLHIGGITNEDVRRVTIYAEYINVHGFLGLGRTLSPEHPIQTEQGAICEDGRRWTDGSSAAYKSNVQSLELEAALQVLDGLRSVTFSYKGQEDDTHVGFIAEEVPDLVAARDRKTLSAMDIVAILTRVVQNQQQSLLELRQKLSRMEARLHLSGIQ